MKRVHPSPAHLAAWRQYYTSFWRVFAAIEADLAAAGLPALSWYDALSELAAASDCRLRMCDLARHALLSRSAQTRQVDKLAEAGLLVRKSCPMDGRVQYAELTEAGTALLRKIQPVYEASVARHFAPHLNATEARQLREIFLRFQGDEDPTGKHRPVCPGE